MQRADQTCGLLRRQDGRDGRDDELRARLVAEEATDHLDPLLQDCQLFQGGIVLLAVSKDSLDRRGRPGELLPQPHDLAEGLVDKIREGEEAEGVARRRCVKDNPREARIFLRIDELDDFRDGHGLVESGRGRVEELAELEVRELLDDSSDP